MTILTRNASNCRASDKYTDGLVVHKFRFFQFPPFGNFIIAREFERFCRKEGLSDYDVLNVHTPAPVIVHSELPSLLTVHNVLASNTEPLRRGSGVPSLARLGAPILGLQERLCMGHYSSIAAISPIVLNQIRLHHGAIHKRLDIVGNGVDTVTFAPEKPELRGSYILYTGRLHRGKRVDILIDAFSRIAGAHQDIRLMIVGDGPSESQLRAFVSDRALNGRVLFAGWLSGDEYVRAVRNALIYVSPSPSEGLSTGILEAMASGVATIAAGISNNRQVIDPMRNGLLFEPGNADDLAENLLKLLLNPGLKYVMEQNCRVHTTQMFDWSKILDNYERILLSVSRDAISHRS